MPFLIGFIFSFIIFIVKIAGVFAYPRFFSPGNIPRLDPFIGQWGGIIFAVWLAFTALSVLGTILYGLRRENFSKRLNIYYTLAFIFIFILISFPTGLGNSDIDRLFFIRNGFPLIFTIGTVFVTDFVLFFTRVSLRLKRQIYPFLTTMNKLVWLGLGISLFTDGGLFGQSS